MAARMFFEQRLIGMMANFGYLIGDPEAKVAAVVDPSFDARVLQKVASETGEAIAPVGGLKVKVVHTPGHSPDSCCFIVAGRVFTGDCLFVGDCGRVDLPGSSIEAMYDSLFTKVRKMDDALVVCPGHHYGPTPTSRIGHEKETNYTLQPRSLEEFKAFMRAP